MGWLSFLDFLVEPTFINRRNAPRNLRISAKFMGWIVIVLFVLLLIALSADLPSLLRIGSTGHPGILVLALIGWVLLELAHLLGLFGAWQMTRDDHSGRRLVIQVLALRVVFSLMYNIGRVNLASFVIQVVATLVLYYFVLISRFPDEAPQAAH